MAAIDTILCTGINYAFVIECRRAALLRFELRGEIFMTQKSSIIGLIRFKNQRKFADDAFSHS
ncbi:hypothetical protein BGP_4900 [Beggiatoa sp. PS]|nr:hypothetical protein BGP_4900 [Beggiatoa sp. PS]